MRGNLDKKAVTLLPNEITEIILVAAGLIIIIVFLMMFLAPGFNVDEETAKSFFNTLKLEISKADKGQTGSFSIWQNERVFLVYFGSKSNFAFKDMGGVKLDADIRESDIAKRHLFQLSFTHKNYLCMCHDLAGKTIKFVKDGETYTRTKCSYCISLKYPAVLSSPELQDSEGRWAFGIDTEFDIKRESGNITFSPKFSAGSGLIDEMLKRKIQIGEVEMAFGDYLLEKFAANCNDMDFEISGGSLTSDRVRIQDETQKYLDELREQDKLDYGRVDYYLDKGIDKKPLHISVFRSYTGETLEYKEAKKLCSGKSVAYIELAKK